MVLKAEVAVLKQSFEKEREARKTGDSLSGEAISQLQTNLEFEKKLRSASMSKLEQHFEAVMSSEIANLKQTLEDRLSHQTSHDIQASYDIDSINDLLDKEIENSFEQFDRHFEESHHKFEDLCMSVLSRSTHESGITEIVHGLDEERAERQGQEEAMHDLLTSHAAQTNNVLEKETSPLWTALRTHNHDMLIDIADQGDERSVQAVTNQGCFTGKSPHILQMNQGGFTPRSIEDNGALTPSTRVSSQALESSLVTPPMSQRSSTPPAKRQYVTCYLY